MVRYIYISTSFSALQSFRWIQVTEMESRIKKYSESLLLVYYRFPIAMKVIKHCGLYIVTSIIQNSLEVLWNDYWKQRYGDLISEHKLSALPSLYDHFVKLIKYLIKRLYLLLTVKESAMDVPSNLEARNAYPSSPIHCLWACLQHPKSAICFLSRGDGEKSQGVIMLQAGADPAAKGDLEDEMRRLKFEVK